jgi:glycosyltransferase involved in cell wall biosynthesis
MPKVSVIITIYNREKYLERCVRSLLEQTLDDVEFLFIDDASTDNSVSLLETIVREYPKRHQQLHVVRMQKNGGRAVARQKGIDSATGEYVIHVDSDDWVDLNMLELLYTEARRTGADIVGCNLMHEYLNYQRIFRQSYQDSVEGNIKGLLNGKIFPSLCTSLTRNRLIKDNAINFPQGIDTGEDLLFNLQLYLHATKIVGIENPSYHYRHTEDSGSFQHTPQSINSVIEVAKRIEQLMKDTGNYEKYEKEIQFRKFSMKCALITNFENEEYNLAWLKLFPETHKFIWGYKQFTWKRRVELWLAAHNLFNLAILFQKTVQVLHRIRHDRYYLSPSPK